MTFTKDNLEITKAVSRKQMGELAAVEVAECIAQLLQEKEEVNIIFAAAPSQNEFLKVLASDKSIEWGRINAFHMDEYIGLTKEAPQGFGNFLRDRLFDLVPFKNVYYIDGQAPDAQVECVRYVQLLLDNPIDIVCLGIGENGHIAFNDPHVALFCDPEMVKVVDLDEKCRMQQVNDGCFAAFTDVPVHAFTLTISALLNSQYMYCIVPGKNKAQAIYDTINGEINERCPASILRRKPMARLFIDADSGSML